MFESQSKKEPKLVFSHKSQQSAPKTSNTQVTQIPRVALVGASAEQPDQTNGDLRGNDIANTSRQPQQGHQSYERHARAQRTGAPRVHDKNEVVKLTAPYVVSEDSRDTPEGQRNSPLHNTQWYQQVDVRMGNLKLEEDNDSTTKTDNNNEELEKNNKEVQHSGQTNNHYKDVDFSAEPVSTVIINVMDEKPTLTNVKSTQFEGFSIYRGSGENVVRKFDNVGTLSNSTKVSQTITHEVISSEDVIAESALSQLKPESDSVMMRHPSSGVRTATDSIPQPYQTVHLPRQEYSMAEQEFLYGPPQGHQYGPPQGHQYGSPQGHQYGPPQGHQYGSAQGHQYSPPQGHQYGTPQGQIRQTIDYRFIAVPQGRVKSYPQTSQQVTHKAFRLVGPVMTDPAYAPVRVRSVSAKQRPHSYSVSPRYTNPVTWQVGTHVGYATLVPERRVAVVKQRGSSISSRNPEQEPPSPKPSTPVRNLRPKSILKSQTQPEVAPEWHQNARAIHIPRAQSIKSPSAAADQNYDFSHILAANSDTVSYGKNKLEGHTAASSRPDTPDAAIQQRNESAQPQKKSVKFSSQVRLHTEDHVSNVVTLSAST